MSSAARHLPALALSIHTAAAELVDVTTHTVAGSQVYLVQATQADGAIGKWILLRGDTGASYTITGIHPMAAPALGAAIEASLLTASRTARSSDPFDGLTYRLGPPPELKLFNRTANTQMFTEGGSVLASPDGVFYMSGHSRTRSAAPGADIEQFARERLLELPSNQAREIGAAAATKSRLRVFRAATTTIRRAR